MFRGHHRHHHAPREFGFGGASFGRGHGRRGPGFGDEEAGPGRRGRFFDQGDLRLVILQLTAEKPRHGYEVIKAVEERVGGLYSPSPGVVYPTLTLLEEIGHVTATQADGKKLYQASDEGLAHLRTNQAAVDGIFARMDAAKAANHGGPAPQIVRAMENLKLALRLKLSGGALDEAGVRAVAKALDEAASAVEQA